jgi:hypothetical protein
MSLHHQPTNALLRQALERLEDAQTLLDAATDTAVPWTFGSRIANIAHRISGASADLADCIPEEATG